MTSGFLTSESGEPLLTEDGEPLLTEDFLFGEMGEAGAEEQSPFPSNHTLLTNNIIA
jgi:hypothetical protein